MKSHKEYVTAERNHEAAWDMKDNLLEALEAAETVEEFTEITKEIWTVEEGISHLEAQMEAWERETELRDFMSNLANALSTTRKW